MSKPAVLSVVLAMLALQAAIGCGGKSAEAPAAPLPPALGVLELPVALRTSDPAPTDSRAVDINMSEVRVDDKVVVKLENGKVPAAEQQDGVMPKLKAALQSPPHGTIALSTHASLPYETLAMVLNSANAAGMHKVALKVRKAGGSTETGWLVASAFQTTPRSYDEVVMQSVDPRTWDEFAKQWQGMHDACRSSKTGSCPYVENSIATGGNVRIELFASGSGVNLNFYRVGLSTEQLAAEEQKRKATLAGHKEDFLQGRVAKSDLEKEMEDQEPATQALFQFRIQETTDPPSVLTEVMRPLCGTKACGVVVTADSSTLTARVVSLIGAAFADGAAAPVLAFELPWTPKPKAPPPPPPAAEPEPDTKGKAVAKHAGKGGKAKHAKKK
ncbi:MAG: ExbD/TolR family protein [Polyangiales bacterium]